jgi:hypothetical protein
MFMLDLPLPSSGRRALLVSIFREKMASPAGSHSCVRATINMILHGVLAVFEVTQKIFKIDAPRDQDQEVRYLHQDEGVSLGVGVRILSSGARPLWGPPEIPPERHQNNNNTSLEKMPI